MAEKSAKIKEIMEITDKLRNAFINKDETVIKEIVADNLLVSERLFNQLT
jgi:hypothetical protein